MNLNTVIIGYGPVGQALVPQIKECGWTVAAIGRSSGYYCFDPEGRLVPSKTPNFHLIKLAFIATPSSYVGRIAKAYAILFSRCDIRTICCDKSLFAYCPWYLDSVGCTAAVGGGSHLLPFVQGHVGGRRDLTVHLVCNASLNFLLSSDKELEEAVREAISLQAIESGATDVWSVIDRELVDVVYKTCITKNLCFPSVFRVSGSHYLVPEQIQVSSLTEEGKEILRERKNSYRYIISFSYQGFEESEALAGFRIRTEEGLFISGGFKRVRDNYQFTRLAVTGLTNAAVIYENGSKVPFYVEGPGAGPVVTARAMIQDARRMLKL